MKPELLDKFFRKECTPQEAKKVALYFKANPAILEKYLSKHEWNDAKQNEVFPDEFWNEVWRKIQKENKAKVFSIIIKRTASVAALVILFAGIIYYIYPSNKKIIPAVAFKNILPKPAEKIVTNTTNTIINVVLEDSSTIKLSPNSTVHYEVPFEKNERDIYLDGEAYFKVSKNKLRPFTVYAAGLATTALGTSFNIRTNKEKSTISVKLFTGKVEIKEVKDFKAWTKDVYLSPGEQLNFDEKNMLVAVGKISIDNNEIKAHSIKNKIVQNNDSLSAALFFNNTSLPQVFNKISAYYNTKIEYDTSLVDTMNFTGTVSKNDSLNVILRAIGEMNNLLIQKDDSGFKISKPKQ